MIKMGFVDSKDVYKVALVLEPGNIERIRKGNTSIISLNELVPSLLLPAKLEIALDYTPDAVWLSQEFKRRDIKDAQAFLRLLKDSQLRPEVVERPYHPDEFLLKRRTH
ncbi:MAG TPA: hypothetical protein VHA06_06975 [Candidatus Angelobacter sp.]|jgi:hypothetical protein|nr:hypothetical protein [Candidatus Angelobacter sp.]